VGGFSHSQGFEEIAMNEAAAAIGKKVQPYVQQQYPWIRYWHSSEHEANLDAYRFLGEPFPWSRSELTTLDAMREEPCLILLGEPGVGKSHELRAERQRLAEAGHHVLWIFTISLSHAATDA
jgi:hypothetical protein